MLKFYNEKEKKLTTYLMNFLNPIIKIGILFLWSVSNIQLVIW